jgi:hypothetical protein
MTNRGFLQTKGKLWNMLADYTWEIWRMAEDNLGFTAVYLNSSVFWDVTQRRLVKN